MTSDVSHAEEPAIGPRGRRGRSTHWPRSATTQRAVLDAARTLFSERGYENTSINDIVQTSGVSVGSIYHQFGGKLEVFTALANELSGIHAAASARAAKRAAGAESASPATIYLAGAHAYLMSTWKERSITRIIIGDDGPAGFSPMRREALERFKHGTEGLTIGTPPLPDSTAFAVTGLLHAAALQIVQVENRRTAKRVADYFIDLLMCLFDPASALQEHPPKQSWH
ncbi:TetR/AcrR family transcriptional regulator [Streptomyces aquilus]|uniref:TetR/AcrR family transcriptional regulator n=1 Tax=Streptomyces aquilus TaxID=2548456 RepID=A0A3Q9C623_9ACTN|nr:TetR/AcrR family transcriptional regulator [Streptomyces aquilus]